MNYWPVKIVYSFSCECWRQVLGLEESLSDHFSVTQQSFFWRGGKTNFPEYLHPSTSIRPLIEKYFGKSKNEKRLCRVCAWCQWINSASVIEKYLIHISISGMFTCSCTCCNKDLIYHEKGRYLVITMTLLMIVKINWAKKRHILIALALK